MKIDPFPRFSSKVSAGSAMTNPSDIVITTLPLKKKKNHLTFKTKQTKTIVVMIYLL